MEKLSFADIVRLTLRGCYNYFADKPLVVSFELTSSCNCNCLHCDKGGIVEGEKPLSPEEIGNIYGKLRPVAVQLSGGEPLLRKDIVDVARAIKEPSGAPYLILVTNGALLDKDIYVELKNAGVNQVSVSLDFPDERHDDFRRRPGLYRHLEKTIPELTAIGNEDVVLNAAISRENLDDVTELCEKAMEWGATMSYSAYSALRTGNREFTISTEEDLRKLRGKIDELLRMKRNGYRIRNADAILESTYQFFAEDGIGGCMSGYRFLLITPQGHFRPCAHKDVKFGSQEELIEGFSRSNDCGGCYVAIRGYCDKRFLTLVREQVLSRVVSQP